MTKMTPCSEYFYPVEVQPAVVWVRLGTGEVAPPELRFQTRQECVFFIDSGGYDRWKDSYATTIDRQHAKAFNSRGDRAIRAIRKLRNGA